VNFRTKNPSTWELNGLLLRMDQTVIRTSRVVKYVLFNPEMPFIYLPQDDFRAFSKPIKDKFGDNI